MAEHAWAARKQYSEILYETLDGIAKITPDTPGFTEVLTSGACRLYRID